MPRTGSQRWPGRLAPAAAGLLLLGATGLARAQDEPASAPRNERSASAASGLLHEASELRRRANERGVEAQKTIDALSDRTDEHYARYTAALSQLASLRSYNERMRELVASQESELASLNTQLDQVDAVGRSVTPLMLRMIESLEDFVALDAPFLLDERRERIAQLRELVLRADVSGSEKYRRIMEAYQIESEYGRTIEAYRGALEPGGDGPNVDFLRFGRIALMYLTLDESEAGVWDVESGSWQPLDRSYVDDVRQGLRIARKQIPPDLINLPLPPPTEGGEG